MAINFPDSPTLNDTFTLGNKTFVFNGTAWLVNNFVGYTGSQGAQGATGFTGSQGPAGNDGATGFTGSQGAQGPAGNDGATGFTGSQGPAGNDGATGFTGSQGVQGPAGNDGATGFTGSQGVQGPIGFTGSSGTGGGGASVEVGTTSPITPSEGDLWWDTDDGRLYIYYNDGDSTQWVEAAPATQGPTGFTGSAGASTLNDLTDVTITSVADGDLIRYNGTAGEWQNTNLGLSVTPTLSAVSSQYFSGQATITNWGTYQDPAAFVQLKNSGGTVVVTNDNIAVDASGNISFNMPAATGTYTLEVQVQDFGDLASEVATIDIDKVAANFRYWRLGDFFYGNQSTNLMVIDWSLYDGGAQTGTNYPPTMTSNTAPTPYVASGTNAFSATYDYYTAFNTNTTNSGYWNLASPSPTTDYLQIDLGQSRDILSTTIIINASYTAEGFKIFASNTGAFSGEEVTIVDYVQQGPITTNINLG